MDLTGDSQVREGDLVTVQSADGVSCFVAVAVDGEVRLVAVSAEELEARRRAIGPADR